MSSINIINFILDNNVNIQLTPIKTNNNQIKTTSVSNKTDLIPGKYEGGLKIWECSLDLLKFLQNKFIHTNLSNIYTLELGCGHGFPGLYMLLKNSFVVFNDFNNEVLTDCTQCYINTLCSEYNLNFNNKYDFISGDWGDFNYNTQFDIILSADTIYNTNNYDKIYNILKNYLKQGGVAYFSTKKFYFGVGGSASQFIEYINNKNEFEAKSINQINDGISNIRVLIEIKWK